MNLFEDIDLNLLKTFSAVMRVQSITKASQVLECSPSAVSLSISRLKKKLGHELFLREGNSIRPTQFANSLHQNLGQSLSLIESTLNAVADFSPIDDHNLFRITSPEQLNSLFLEVLPYPNNSNIKFALREYSSSEEDALEDIRLRNVDVVIDNSLFDSNMLDAEQIFEEPIVLVCRVNHPVINQAITNEQYEVLPQVALSKRRRNKYPLSAYITTLGVNRNIVYETDSFFGSLILCSTTDYFAHVPLSIAKRYQEKLQLQVITPPIKMSNLKYYLMWHKANTHSSAHQWLRERIKLAVR
ncbi:LysR substrate-binding domain-containing protein [Vibrio kyushuensis]|uniref:LysR substrate-binding domain-containing protein n=1 Tax=Vibrio TaxID=662 RepID=UPI003D1503E4